MILHSEFVALPFFLRHQPTMEMLIGAELVLRQVPHYQPTPNREQRVLAHYAEVRRRKTEGQWGI